jgi:hypothetical protein
VPDHLRVLFATLCAACCAGVLALVPVAQAAPLTPNSGVQTAALSPHTPAASTTRTLDRAKTLGAKVIRLEVLWSDLEPRAAGQRDEAYLAAADRLVDGAAARGMRVMLLVDGTPCWASTAPESDRGTCQGADANRRAVIKYPPRDPQDYVNVSTFLAARYGAKLAAFEVWNEPDQANQLYWAGPDKIKRYVALTKAVYGPLKQANPQMPVIAGAFVGTNGKWLQALYDAGFKGFYDGLSVHFYDLPLAALQTTRAVQRRNGDQTPMWLAEFGFSSCYKKGRKDAARDHVCLTGSGQAAALSDTLNAIAGKSWITSAIIYELDDESAGYNFGVYSPAGKRKASYAKVKRAFSGKRSSITKAKLKLTRRGGRLIASGAGSWIEVYELKVKRNGVLRYRALLRTDRFGKIRVVLPKQLSGRGLTVSLRGQWTHSGVTRRS